MEVDRKGNAVSWKSLRLSDKFSVALGDSGRSSELRQKKTCRQSSLFLWRRLTKDEARELYFLHRVRILELRLSTWAWEEMPNPANHFTLQPLLSKPLLLLINLRIFLNPRNFPLSSDLISLSRPMILQQPDSDPSVLPQASVRRLTKTK
ncbi:unnamed protein product [Thlaspi arvense]|uniref:Uncharacterized protein n=1 Tax=Thlaspi arvense TaxID=13288 RepID=A0AAU9RQG0_THLAR|nr:unnamed protein product [Thlaspi arvense]